MYIAWQIKNENKQEDLMIIYQIINKRWKRIQSFKVSKRKELFERLQELSFSLDYAVIKMNTSYRNTIYYCCPQVRIIIDRDEVTAYYNRIFEERMKGYEEAAAAIDNSCMLYSLEEENDSFINLFYHKKTRCEAIRFYELWQRNLPLNDKKISKFIRTMEFYFDEVINYFDLFADETLN